MVMRCADLDPVRDTPAGSRRGGPEEVEPAALTASRAPRLSGIISRRPEVAQLALAVPDAELHLLDMGAGLLEGAHRVGDHRGDARIDREDVEVGAVADLPALMSRCIAAVKSTVSSRLSGSRGS